MDNIIKSYYAVPFQLHLLTTLKKVTPCNRYRKYKCTKSYTDETRQLRILSVGQTQYWSQNPVRFRLEHLFSSVGGLVHKYLL